MLSMLILLLLQGNFTALRLGAQGSFPKPLSAQEERRCLELAAAGDQAARGKLIEHNLRLVAHIVKKYYTQIGGDTDDLISIGTLGLIKAVNTYNMEKKIKLATYAARCIENEVLMYLRKTRRLAGEVSLNDALDQEDEGSALSLMDVIRVEDTMLEDLNTRDACRQVRDAVEQCLGEAGHRPPIRSGRESPSNPAGGGQSVRDLSILCESDREKSTGEAAGGV